MSMKPILFNTEMVRAILEGRKTVTRRLVKPQPGFFFGVGGKIPDPDNPAHIAFVALMPDDHEEIYVPPYQPGDVLYVRETWRVRNMGGDIGTGTRYAEIEYKAGGTQIVHGAEGFEKWRKGARWLPSIHIPKTAARLFLRVKDVRVERLRAITEADAQKEGCEGLPCDCANKDEHGCVDCFNTGWIEPPVMDFMYLWDSTIKPADLPTCGWDANPWVWVIEFERCEKPEDLTHE